MLPVGFELTISAGERPQTYALDRAASGISRSESFVMRIFTKQFVMDVCCTEL